MRKKLITSIILFQLLILSFSFHLSEVHAQVNRSGQILNENGFPIADANIWVLSNNKAVDSTKSDDQGYFDVIINNEDSLLLIFADSNETIGIDYFPETLNLSEIEDLEVYLTPSFSVILDGVTQYVDTENLPLETNYHVTGPSGESYNENLPDNFVPNNDDFGKLPELGLNHVLLPLNVTATIRVTTTILIEYDIIDRNYNITVEPVEQGNQKRIDIRKYNIPFNNEITKETRQKTENLIQELDEYGFYLQKQRNDFSDTLRLHEEAKDLYEQGEYTASFESLKRAYLGFSHTTNELTQLFNDAKFSVYILIFFMAIVSFLAAYIITNTFLSTGIMFITFYGLTAITLFYFYPGSKIISKTDFIFRWLISIFFITISVLTLPKLSRGRKYDEHVRVRELIIPMFRIAKRSLLRRRTRFLLTLISLTVLVMSFVTLTSFSEGYGVTALKLSGPKNNRGVLIRASEWESDDPKFMLENKAEETWLLSQTEVISLSMKGENYPTRRPLFRVSEQPIIGIIGIEESEIEITDIQSSIIRGNIPNNNGVVISEVLSEETNVDLGDTLKIGHLNLTIQGIFEDEFLNRMNDLDGSDYLPPKWKNIAPPGEAPVYIIATCEPNEVIILSLKTSLTYPTVGIERYALKLSNESKAEKLASRLSLERGYLSWSSTYEGIYRHRLGSFFEGKGLSLFIPWAIVVLNVVVTMLNSLYERRKEIEILSSVGLNPAQISSVFVIESTLTGFLAGGGGYLIGLVFYRIINLIGLNLQIQQKVSVFWVVASIGLSIFAVLSGAYVALRRSIVITPSLMRRWKIDIVSGNYDEPWIMRIPLKLEAGEVSSFIDYLIRRLRELEYHPVRKTSSIKIDKKGDETRISYNYKSVHATADTFYTTNTLYIRPKPDGEFELELRSVGNQDWVYASGSLIRRITIEYSAEKSS